MKIKDTEKGLKQVHDLMEESIKKLNSFSIETVTDCCGVPPYLESEDMGICPECKEHCEYICEHCDDNSGYHETEMNGHDVVVYCHNCNTDGSKTYK